MSNIESVNALLTAINFDRFADIAARHQADAVFSSFRGPTLNGSVRVADWHRTFLRDYADCNYSEIEYVEDGETVCVRATIEAKGYDWRPFTQRVLEVFRMEEGEVAERHLYGMLRDVEFDKATAAAMANATGYRGGSAAETRKAVEGFYAALLSGKAEEAMGFLHEKAAMIDSVYGITNGPQNILDVLAQIPTPAFGYWRVNKVFAGPKDAAVELSIDPTRPRAGDWIRMVDGKIAVIEAHWMLREIGLNPFENYANDRHRRQVILPI